MMMKVSLLAVALTATTTCTHAFVVKPATKHTISTKSTGMIAKQQQQQQEMGRRRRPTTHLQSFLTELFSPKAKAPVRPVFDPVVIDPDFRVAALFLTVGVALDFVPYAQLTVGPLVTLLGVLFLVQTFRIRFVFDEEGAFELKTSTNEDDLGDSGENRIVGGANRWDTETIIKYDFFPKGSV